MRNRLVHIAPLQTAKVLAAIYFVISVPIALLMLIPVLLGFGQQGAGMGLLMVILTPFLYALAGFLFTLLGAWIYNLVAARLGGIEYTTITAVER
ncbi:MAG: hypothetical protein JSR94_09365 [Proteobacteria bacterium]|nr:hypothetical protein [Pseudomonadota bacterium]HNF65503.1 hypothetical protein [Plasticicumulans sp.]